MKAGPLILALGVALAAGGASASWYWPFGTNDMDGAKSEGPRLSELMEPASLAIDEATDCINDGETDKAVEKYREALRLLDRLELEHAERAATPEFQSVRNKRAYVDAQLNAILIQEARVNAKAVAITDTTELERKLAKKRAAEAGKKDEEEDENKSATADKGKPKLESQLGEYMDDARARAKKVSRAAVQAKFERETQEKILELFKDDPDSHKARIMRAGLELYRKNYGNARKDLDILLVSNPDDVSALNLLAAVEVACGNNRAAEDALARAIRADKRDYHAYYNLAKLLYRQSKGEDEERARKFYRNGRDAGGPEDPYLEKVLK